jgi:hypothetical protein
MLGSQGSGSGLGQEMSLAPRLAQRRWFAACRAGILYRHGRAQGAIVPYAGGR